MTRILLAILVVFAVGAPVRAEMPSTPIQLSASTDQMVCFKACLDKYGATKQQSCAIECGLAGGALSGGGQQRDCGIEYSRCMRDCGKDEACKSKCRDARQSCI